MLPVNRTSYAPVPRSQPKSSLILFEPNRELSAYLQKSLARTYNLQLFEDPEVFLKAVQTGIRADLVVFAWESTPRPLLLLQTLREQHATVPVIIVSCAVEASDYKAFSALSVAAVVLKPFAAKSLEAEMTRCLSAKATGQAETQETPLENGLSFVRLNERMLEVERQATLVARSDIPVLILGESGTGKEVLALFTHKMSRRSDRIFLKINCAAMPADLLESELFGYEQGAFTGALKTKPGKFEVCDGGTIYLDEIGEMPAILQAKLLQVLQDGTFSRLGSRASMRTDVRIIAATNINMKQSMQNKLFREDLYYRLNGLSLHLPPLRERLDEVPALAEHFMRKGAKKHGLAEFPLSPALLDVLRTHSWPGNLRELENLINRLLILRDENAIYREIKQSREHVHAPEPERVATMMGDGNGNRGLKRVVRDMKQDTESVAILKVLEETNWNRKSAAAMLDISYKALLYKIKHYELVPDSQQAS